MSLRYTPLVGFGNPDDKNIKMRIYYSETACSLNYFISLRYSGEARIMIPIRIFCKYAPHNPFDGDISIRLWPSMESTLNPDFKRVSRHSNLHRSIDRILRRHYVPLCDMYKYYEETLVKHVDRRQYDIDASCVAKITDSVFGMSWMAVMNVLEFQILFNIFSIEMAKRLSIMNFSKVNWHTYGTVGSRMSTSSRFHVRFLRKEIVESIINLYEKDNKKIGVDK